ncbi:MAG: DUF4097 family beta strand repeat-containing protein [Peptococcaceae bacterium]|nr:DUF4097 family beta strand repeat-containing protein [Peptococcaceae bacterium]
MDARIKLLLKKTRPIQLLFIVVAVVCLLVFLVFNFSLNDHSGAFESRHAAQQVEIPATRDGLTDLTIEASGVQLEVGMVSSLSKPQVILAGNGYSDQLAKVDLEGTECTISLEGEAVKRAQDLTMQVLLPQGDYSSISINGENLDLHIDDLRTSYLIAQIDDSGYAYFANIKADSVQIVGGDTPLRFYNNQATSLVVSAGDGSVTYLENDFDRVDTETQSGGIFYYDTRVKGQWNLSSETGDITMLSRNLPYNLLIQAQSNSSVEVGYDQRYWKDADVVSDDGSLYIGSTGNNPNKFIQCITDSGNIYIGQRERYSNLDPYAADYPYADNNPYMIERSTITK